MLRSVKNWLTLLFLAVLAVAILTAFLYVIPPLEDRLVTQKLNDLGRSSDLVIGGISQYLQVDPSTGRLSALEPELGYALSLIDNRLDARIVVLNASNMVKIADSRSGAPFNILDFPVLNLAKQTGTIRVATADVAGTEYAAVAVPLRAAGVPGPVAIVLVSASLHDVRVAVSTVERQLLLATGLGLLLAVAVGYLAAYFITRRIKRIERSAEAIAAGDLDAKVNAGVHDEIGQLGLTFNTMGERLREAFSQIEREKEQVEVLLDDLTEGVIGLSEVGEVRTANPRAQELLRQPLESGTPLSAVAPDDLVRAWEDSRQGEDQTVVFECDERTLEASVYRAERSGDIRSIIIVRDVTDQVRLERAQREFIATASHELKTPLFSLSGFMELLDEGDLDAETQRDFLDLMRQQIDRLTNLSLSLLDLSQVDAGGIRLHPAIVELSPLAYSVAAEFRQRLAAKGARIVVSQAETGEAPLVAYCDEMRLAQVLRALLDNAVKFSPADSTVTVALSRDREAAVIVVSDQGPGVPPGERERIFERFYHGTQNGAQSGSGLGLSIARELVELMGGTLTVGSEGVGASFVVRLPASPPPDDIGDAAVVSETAQRRPR
jgi:two-component system sensor histidine kinase VicK